MTALAATTIPRPVASREFGFFVPCCSYSKGFFFSERFVSFLPSTSKNTANFNLA